MSHATRLRRLEALAGNQEHDDGYADWMAVGQAVMAGMAPEHRALVEADWPLVICTGHCWPASGYRNAHPLAHVLYDLILDVVLHQRAVALPPAVASI